MRTSSGSRTKWSRRACRYGTSGIPTSITWRLSHSTCLAATRRLRTTNFIATWAAGLHYTTYAHMGNGIWNSGKDFARGGAEAGVRHRDHQRDIGVARNFAGPLTHGRVYSEKEIWDNYEYFIKKAIPVAENGGYDPSRRSAGADAGVPRCIFGSFEDTSGPWKLYEQSNVGVCAFGT